MLWKELLRCWAAGCSDGPKKNKGMLGSEQVQEQRGGGGGGITVEFMYPGNLGSRKASFLL